MKISLICAYPVKSNPGMNSVDLAFESLRPFLNNCQIDRLCSWKPVKISELGSIEYKEFHSISQLEDSDKIIFWGDFLHWLNYGRIDWVNKWKKINPNLSYDTVIDSWYKLFLLEDRPDLQKKTIVFGNTLYGLNATQLSDERYSIALKNLYTNTKLCMTRDIISSNLLYQITNNEKIHFGCDCALLLDSEAFIDLYRPFNIVNSNYLVYSFGRSGNADLLTKFAIEISNELGLIPVHLEWLKKKTGFKEMAQYINLIRGSFALITDIYHCTVTGYREHVPTICIGNGTSIPRTTLSDNKKEIFHYQHFINDRYRYLENIQKDFEYEKKQSMDIIKNKDAQNFINQQLESHVKNTTQILINEINS
jgi:hypothetical protein